MSATWHNWTIKERFMRKVEQGPGCWMWRGFTRDTGYGSFWWPEKVIPAHRAAYLLFHGPIPDGMTVDHICFQPSCVNPDHLQLLTLSQNAARQRKALSDYCQRGHEFTPENTMIQLNRTGSGRRSHYRLCRACREESQRRRIERRRAARRAAASA